MVVQNNATLVSYFSDEKKNPDLLFEVLCGGQVETIDHSLHIGCFIAENSCSNIHFIVWFSWEVFICLFLVKVTHAPVPERLFSCAWCTSPLLSRQNIIVVTVKACGAYERKFTHYLDFRFCQEPAGGSISTHIYRGIRV